MNLRPIPFVAALLVIACRTSDVPASSFSNNPHAVPIPLTRFNPDSLAFAQYSGVAQAQNFVIRDATAWNDLWQRIYANLNPVPPPPDIDFSREMVVAVALGTRNSGGYNVLLTQAAADSAGILVSASATSPGARCVTTQALTQPLDIGRIAHSDQPVRFTVSQHVLDCGS